MTTPTKSASDASYHSRHARRTLRRAERIASHIESPGAVLDVGCNNGITSQYLLDAGKARHVTGIELHESTVDKSLRDNPNFDLIEGNIVDIDLKHRFDHVVYGAVHHHILNLYGLTAAIETLQKLVSHCDGHLFFETGQVGEGGRWAWQRAIRQHFRTDEEHFFYLLRSVEHLIEDFEVIGTFWIHGIRRYYLRLDIARNPGSELEDVDRVRWPEPLDGPYIRSRGSRNQTLSRDETADTSDSPTQFWIAGAKGDDRRFIKKHCHHPYSTRVEWAVGRQVQEDWAVRPVARTDRSDALVFPYLEDAASIGSFAAAPEATKRMLAAMVLEIYSDAADSNIRLPEGVLLSAARELRLIDVVDLNPNNLLVMHQNGNDIIRVVDFEQQGVHYAYRNRMHLARVLWSLRQQRVTAVMNYLSGLAGAVRKLFECQFHPFAARIRTRQPAFLSLLVADVRSITGRMLGRVLAVFGLE